MAKPFRPPYSTGRKSAPAMRPERPHPRPSPQRNTSSTRPTTPYISDPALHHQLSVYLRLLSCVHKLLQVDMKVGDNSNVLGRAEFLLARAYNEFYALTTPVQERQEINTAQGRVSRLLREELEREDVEFKDRIYGEDDEEESDDEEDELGSSGAQVVRRGSAEVPARTNRESNSGRNASTVRRENSLSNTRKAAPPRSSSKQLPIKKLGNATSKLDSPRSDTTTSSNGERGSSTTSQEPETRPTAGKRKRVRFEEEDQPSETQETLGNVRKSKPGSSVTTPKQSISSAASQRPRKAEPTVTASDSEPPVKKRKKDLLKELQITGTAKMGNPEAKDDDNGFSPTEYQADNGRWYSVEAGGGRPDWAVATRRPGVGKDRDGKRGSKRRD